MLQLIFSITFLCALLYMLVKPSRYTAIEKIPYFLVLYSVYNIWQGYIVEMAVPTAIFFTLVMFTGKSR